MDRWDYRDLTIPLGLKERDRDLDSRYHQVVLDHLQRAGHEGWQADEPIDLRSALTAGRIKQHKTRFGWRAWGQTTYESVTIRLKRLAQGD
jgi:hypothetical protein